MFGAGYKRKPEDLRIEFGLKYKDESVDDFW
jgi:hypothetical protein